MGKIKKNIRAKAKAAVAKVAKNLQQQQQLNKASAKSKKEDKIDLLLHKTQSRIPTKNTISKKEKFRQKHKNLMNKFALLKKQRKEEIARKNREKTAIIGDLKPLKDSLPSLDELITLSKNAKNIKTGIQETPEESQKLSIKQKIRQKKQKFVTKVNSYEALLKLPDFKTNPRDAISYHIQQNHCLIDE